MTNRKEKKLLMILILIKTDHFKCRRIKNE